MSDTAIDSGEGRMTVTEHKAYMVANPLTPGQAVVIDPAVCGGCNTCVEVCRTDVLLPNPDKGKPPVVLYPDECWFCASCVEHCTTGAIQMVHPLNQRIGWKRKATGEYFRVGMKDPPPPNNRPPVGGWGSRLMRKTDDDGC